MKALETRTMVKHRRCLEMIKGMATWEEVITRVEMERTRRSWKASTTLTRMGEVKGALKRSAMYGKQIEIKGDEQLVRDYCKGLQKAMTVEVDQLKQAKPITTQQVDVILTRLFNNDSVLFTFVILMWATAARPECIMQIKKRHVEIEGTRVKILFTSGKGAKCRLRPYTVHSSVGKREYGEAARRFLGKMKADELVFKREQWNKIRKDTLKVIRTLDEGLSLYSFRRGAAITLQKDGGATKEQVRTFLGHADVQMTERYMNWGWYDTREAETNSRLAMTMFC